MKPRHTGWHFFPLFFVLVIMISCNNGVNKKKEDKTDTIPAVAGGGPGAAAIGTFPIYKIEKKEIDFNYEKLILDIELDDLSNPTTMKVACFPSMKAGGGGGLGIQFYTTATGTDAANFDKTKIMICNNEIILANYDWPNIDFLLLEPTRIGGNLGFNITAYGVDGGGAQTEVPIGVPEARATKPSPPAPPSIIPKTKKNK